MLYIVGTSISLFLAVLLLLKKEKHDADLILILWMVSNALHQFLFYMDVSGISANHPFWAALNVPFAYLHGPFLFLYISQILFRNRSRKYFALFHFLPFVLGFIYLHELYLLEPEAKVYNINHGLVDFATEMNWHFKAVLLSGFTYIILSIFFLLKHKAKYEENYSASRAFQYKWILLLIVNMLIVWVVLIVGNIHQVFVIAGINTTVAGIFGIRNTPYFIDPVDLSGAKDEVVQTSDSASRRYNKSGLTNSLRESLDKDLNRLMVQEKMFTECDLSLDKLALELEVHPNYLSQYINEVYNQSFYHYINQLRVEEFKERIQLPQNNKFSFLALALECGFNSKASFNRNFKKITGLTPTEFLQKNRKDLSYS